jgi:hypothetical protein
VLQESRRCDLRRITPRNAEFKITTDLQTFAGRQELLRRPGAGPIRHALTTLRTVPVNLAQASGDGRSPESRHRGSDGKVSRYVELDFRPGTPSLRAPTGWHGSLNLGAGESRVAVYTATLLPATLRLPLENEPGGNWYVPSGPTGVIEVTLHDD